MAFGTIQVGRLALREAISPAQEKTDDVGLTTLTISGQEASPPHTLAEIAQIQDDIRCLGGMLLPVTWTDKADRNGYYVVSQPQATLLSYQGEVITCDWSLNLTRAGTPGEVDLEARLSGPLTRTNTVGATGERWHCPPGGHTAYWSSTTSPSTMVRTGLDGPLTVYRNVPQSVSPRYSCDLAAYPAGRVRFIMPVSDAGVLRERSGIMLPVAAFDAWEMHNSLIRARWDAGGLKVASHDGTAWEPVNYSVTVNGTALGAPTSVTILRNDYEAGIVRLLWNRAPAGRVTVDLTIRRGSRLVEGWVQSLPSTTITVALIPASATTAGTGYLTGTANDVNGNRFLLASAAAVTASTTASSLTATSVTALDFCVGAVVGGGSAVAGDTAPNLYAQMLGSATEQTRTIRR